jgi:hypothetical protein
VECPDLASELVRLAREDLAIRQRLAETGELSDGYHPEMRAVHRRNGDRLTEVLDQVGCWPGHHLVGRDGSSAAFLIAQHDIANPALMRLSRELYAAAVEQGDADPAKLAQLEDRIRYFEGRHQWYGTHWGWDEDGEFGPWPPVEKPERVDERRNEMGLPPLAEAINAARKRAVQEGRAARRPADEILDEHRQADDFAKQAGWRTHFRSRG